MNSSIRMIIVSLLSTFLLFQGCSSGGGSSSSSKIDSNQTDSNQTDSNQTDSNQTQIIQKSGSFSIIFKDKDTKVFDYTLSIKRGADELTNTLQKYISSEKRSDGSIVISLTADVNGGLTSLALGDVVTLKANAYTPQQFIIDEGMLKKSSASIALKAVDSRLAFTLGDLMGGADSVAPRSARGVTVHKSDKGLVFETKSGTSLTLPTVSYNRLIRKLSRVPRSSKNSKVYIDMTSIDPRTEHDATIGDFSYDPSREAVNTNEQRSLNATSTEGQTGLESVVMADMKMSMDGQEIHCFDGDYDPATNTCNGGATATLKMKIPQSQFQQYSQKYNDGDRVVPLYSYNEVKATWQRQLDTNGIGMDAELVLTDNNNNKKADKGDVLYLVGKVGHFSWWNGDYYISRTCLNLNVDLSKAPEASSYVRVKGVDYTGRVFTKYLAPDTTAVSILAKANALVSVELIMSDGSVGDSVTYATRDSATCYDTNITLVAPPMNTKNIDVIVTDMNGKPLKDAYLKSKGQYEYTDENGTAKFSYNYSVDSNLSETLYAFYSTSSFRAENKVEITQDTSSQITIKLDTAEKSFHGRVFEVVNREKRPASGAYVRISNYDPYYYKYVKTDENGSFEAKFQKSAVENDSNGKAYIYIWKYNEEYAFYPSYTQEIDVSASGDVNLGEFDLQFDTHMVSGQVIDSLGQPIGGSHIYSYGNTYRYTKSDENGNYTMTIFGQSGEERPIQAYTYKDGYHYSNEANFTTEVNGFTTQNLMIDLRKATIKGRVLNSKGIALANMRVYWSRDYYNYISTDENGSFSLETYNGGDGDIRVYDSSSHSYLDFSPNTDIRDIKLDGVEVGKVYDLENMQVVEKNFAPIISKITIDPDTPLVNVPFTINIDAYDPDGDIITYKIEKSNYYYSTEDAIIDSGDSSIATITANRAGYYSFTLKVTDEYENSTTKRVTLYVKNHVRPVINSVSYTYPNNKNYFDKSEDLNITVDALSDEGNSLSYSYKLENLTPGKANGIITNNGTTAIIGQDIADGRYKLAITVSDAYNETTTERYITIDSSVIPELGTFMMNGENRTSLTVKQDDKVDLNVTLRDAQHVSNPTWSWYINGNMYTEKQIAPIAFNNEGQYYGYVYVRDDQYRSDYQEFYINVQEDAKPVIDSVSVTPSVITKVGDKYVNGENQNVTDIALSVLAHDDDDTNLSYTFASLGDSDVTVNENNATYTLPSGLKVGKHAIKVTVSDGTKSVDYFVNIEVLKDSPPVITEFIVPLKTKVSKTFDLKAKATDSNGQTVTYNWRSTSGTLKDASSQNAKLTVGDNATDINVTLTVSDGANDVVRTREVEVLANQAPIISYLNLRTLSVSLDNQEIKLKSIFADTDGTIKEAKYVVELNGTKKAELTVSQSDVLTTWDPQLKEAGTYSVYLEVTDDDNKTITSNPVSLVVQPGNSAPTITSLTATSSNLLINEITELNVVAIDVDGDALSYAWSSSEGGEVIQDARAQDKATFSAQSAGTYTITVVVTDTSGAKGIQTTKVNVKSATLSISSDKNSYILGSDVTLTASMSSEYAIPSNATWKVVEKPSTSKLSITTTGASVTLTPDVVGSYKVEVDTVIHGVEFSAEKSFSVQKESKADLEGVIKSDSGDILSGAKVRLYNKTDATLYDTTVTTGSDGAYSFSEVPAGYYYLVVYAGSGYVSHTEVVEIVK